MLASPCPLPECPGIVFTVLHPAAWLRDPSGPSKKPTKCPVLCLLICDEVLSP
jgi:hypothetical protein